MIGRLGFSSLAAVAALALWCGSGAFAQDTTTQSEAEAQAGHQAAAQQRQG